MKFKSDIEVQAGIKDYAGSSGTAGQVLSSDGATVSWIDAEIGVARDVQNEVKAGVAINKGQAVYVTSADGTNIIVGLASNTSEATSSKTLGLLNATVAANGFADVVQIGRLSGLNTIGAVVGDPVWLGTNGNLIYGLANKPYAPAHLVYIGVVTRVNANNGEIFVTVQNGFELKEIHDVDIVSTAPVGNDILAFEGAPVNLWKNKTIPAVLGYTPADQAITISTTAPLSGGGNLSANRTLSIAQANATTNGYLSSADWTTFNNKQTVLNGTGFVKVSGTTVTYDNSTYVPTTRTITINGVTQDLAANQTWTVTGGVSGSGVAGQVAYWDGTTSITGESNLFWDSTGDNLGIGTAIPSRKLHVSATGNNGIYIQTTNEAQITMSGYDSTNSIYYCGYDGTGLYYQPPAAQINKGSSTGITFPINYYSGGDNGNNSYLSFQTQASEKMRITSGGNVGISTQNPYTPLQVGTSNFNITDRMSAVYGAESQTIFTVGRSGVDYPQLLNFGVNQAGLYSTISARQFTVSTENKLVLQPNGGLVGIGTTSPTAAILHLNYNSVNNRGIRLQDQNGIFDLITSGAGQNHSFGLYDDTNGAYRMFISPSGNTGIGTTTDAGYKLDVNGSGRFSNLLQVNGPSATTRSDSDGISVFNGNVDYRLGFDSVNGTRGYIRYNVDSALSTHGHIFSAGDWNATPTDLMLIRGDGNVGIGITTGITQKLVVDGGGTDAAPIFAKSSLLYNSKYYSGILAGYATSINQSTQFGYIYDSTNAANSIAHITAYGTAEGSQFSMRANGNVGIGITTDAGYKLDVNGNIRVGGSSLIYFNTTGSPGSNFVGTINDYWLTLQCNRGDSSRIDLTNGNGILFSIGGSERMSISPSGAVKVNNLAGTGTRLVTADASGNLSTTTDGAITSYNSTLTLNTSWQNTGIDSSVITTSGVYLVTCLANDYAVGGAQYSCTYVGTMYFYAGGTNGVNANEIALHHSGHADNGRYIYLRTLGSLGADSKLYLQIKGNGTNTGNSTYVFTFKKLL